MMEEDFAWPSAALLRVWREWIELHAALRAKGVRWMAAPFFSAATSQRCPNRIMVVGKATTGNCWLDGYKKALDSPDVDDVIRNRLIWNRELVRKHGNSKAFWTLFRRLASVYPDRDSCSFIYSNIAKIGSRKGNPKGVLLSAQKDLAARTLRAEIKEYRPVLVVFTTGSYAGDVIDSVCHGNWKQSKSARDRELWWREGSPAMLGTRHPQGVRKDKIDFWIEKARQLVGTHSGSA